MTLQSLICPSCGGQIDTFDSRANQGFCPFCGSLIQNIPGLQAQFKTDSQGRVMVSGIESSDELFERIEANMRFKDTAKALELIDEFTDKYPTEFRGWRALAEVVADGVVSGTANDTRLVTAIERMCILADEPAEREYLRLLQAQLFARKQDVDAKVAQLEAWTSSAKAGMDAATAAFDAEAATGANMGAKTGSEASDKGCRFGCITAAVVAIGVFAGGIADAWVIVVAIALGLVVYFAYTFTKSDAIKKHDARMEAAQQEKSRATAEYGSANDELNRYKAFAGYLNGVLAAFSG